jgi:hypothetical protein
LKVSIAFLQSFDIDEAKESRERSHLLLRSRPSSALLRRPFSAGHYGFLFHSGRWNPLAAEEMNTGTDSVCCVGE